MGELYITDKDGKTTKLGEVNSGLIYSNDEIPMSFKYLDMIKDAASGEISVTCRTKWWDTKDLRKLCGIKWYQWWWLKIQDFFYFLFNEVE